tara:strand:+ start:466 stop:846 length:381 start_codon:yes stop_codon:yes gene_type:complete
MSGNKTKPNDAPRDERGYFVAGPRPDWSKGKLGGRKPGLPSLRSHLVKMIEDGKLPIEKRLTKVATKLFDMAEQGNIEAMKLLFQHIDDDPNRAVGGGITVVVNTGVPLSVINQPPRLQIEEGDQG